MEITQAVVTIDQPKKSLRTRKKEAIPVPVFDASSEGTPGHRPPKTTAAPNHWRSTLPTFSWEEGYRIVTDPVTEELYEVPLTLFDVLYESEEDIGAVFMTQGADHSMVAYVIASILRAYLSAQQWLILNDVYIRWGGFTIQPKAPDVAAIPSGRMPPTGKQSYVVGRDGPLPSFVVEITSKQTRKVDLETKKEFYASLGIQEYLIIDMLPRKSKDWQLIGYRLKDEPTYTKITPDAQGGIRFEGIGLRFVAIGHTRVEVYDGATGQRLLTPEELKSQAEVEAARARIEAERADAAEAEVAQLKAWIAEQLTKQNR